MEFPIFPGSNILDEKLPRKERRNLQQREEILSAALKLFSENGYHKVSMQEIAKEAEYGVGTIYKFFENKEELYKALIMDVCRKWHQELISVLERDSHPVAVIREFVALRQKLFTDNIAVMRLYFAETRGASFNPRAGLDQDLIHFYNQGISKLTMVFVRGIKEKIFQDHDPFSMALALDGMINAFLLRMMEDPSSLSNRSCVTEALEIFFGGVLKRQSG